MSVYQLLSCDVALAGDILNVVARHAQIPVTYPEMIVLKFIHGENAVTSIIDVGAVEREDAAEMARLVETYGDDPVRTKIFPGSGARLPNGDNRYRPVVKAEAPAPEPTPAPEPAPEPTPAPEPAPIPPGTVDYAASAASPGFVPSAEPVAGADDPFGDHA